MPCYDDRDSPSNVRAESQAQIDKLTRLLCEACLTITNVENKAICSVELREWWANHQKIDKKRKQEERQAKRGIIVMAELTKAEREALGL